MDTKIKRWRKEKTSLSQQEMAERTGIPISTYRNYEQGVTPYEKIPNSRVEAIRKVIDEESLPDGQRRVSGSRDPQTDYVTRPQRDRSTGGTDIPSPNDSAGQPVPIWSGRAPAHTDRMMYLPEDLITSTALDITEAAVIPVLGSGAAPHLRHGQRVLVLPTDRVQGLDLYVYYAREQQAHLIAQMERRGEALLVTTTEGTRTLRRTEDGAWTDGDHTEHIQVVARVSHALIPVADVMAREQETARNAGRAVQAFLSG